jgi:DNA-directed RNA polymerase specialized sigma subunit
MGITQNDLDNCMSLRLLVTIIRESTADMREMAESVTIRHAEAAVQTSGTSDKTGKGAVNIAQLTAQLDEIADEFAEQAEKVCGPILRLEDPMHRLVLFLRYVEGYDWYTIEKKVHCSRTTVYRIHLSARKALGIKS